MNRDRGILDWLAEDLDLPGETAPGQTLTELVGDRRVLIEKHGGVTRYSGCRIDVKVSFGHLAIFGTGLELARMTREQLVITGCIESINLIRRERK